MTNDDGSTSSDNSSNNIQKIKIKKKRALVIGAGPSGIVTAKYLLQERPGEYDVTIVESSTTIGGTFVNKVYESSKLVSSKYITAFSDYRFDDLDNDDIDNDIEGEDDDDVSGSRTRRSSQTSKSGKSGGRVHPTTEEYVTYLQKYCRKYDVYDKIKFRCTVTSIQDMDVEKDEVYLDENDENNVDLDTNGYIVKYEEETTTKATTTTTAEEVVIVVHEEHFDIVAVCSGLHNVPYIPQSIVDLKEKTTKQKKQHDNDDDKDDSCYDSTFYYDGDILHSSEYKSSDIFSNKRVLIVGSGETAMDIAYHAISNTQCVSVAMNVRRGFLSIPHTLRQGHHGSNDEQPLDVFITNLFEHAYEHPWVHKLRLRWILSTWIIRLFLWFTGSSVGFNQWCCETSPIKRGYHIINKSHLAMNHLNVPIKKKKQRDSGWSGFILGRFWLWFYNESNLRPIISYHKTCIIGLVKENENEEKEQQQEQSTANTTTTTTTTSKTSGTRTTTTTTTSTRSSRTILFDDGRTYQADIIILATGYKQSFPFLHESILQQQGRNVDDKNDDQVNKNESSSNTPSSSSTKSQRSNNDNNTDASNFVVDEDPLPCQHFITYRNRPRLGFIGFVRPNVGASKCFLLLKKFFPSRTHFCLLCLQKI